MTASGWRKVLFEPFDVVGVADARPMDDFGWGYDGDVAPAALAGAIRTALLNLAGFNVSLDAEAQPERLNVALQLGVPRTRKGAPELERMTLQVAGPFITDKTEDSRLLWPAPRLFGARRRDLPAPLDVAALQPYDGGPILTDDGLSRGHLLTGGDELDRPLTWLMESTVWPP